MKSAQQVRQRIEELNAARELKHIAKSICDMATGFLYDNVSDITVNATNPVVIFMPFKYSSYVKVRVVMRGVLTYKEFFIGSCGCGGIEPEEIKTAVVEVLHNLGYSTDTYYGTNLKRKTIGFTI